MPTTCSHRHSLNSPRRVTGSALSQLRMEAQTLAGLLRLMSTSSGEDKVGDRFDAVYPLSVALGPQSHPHRPANSGFRPCLYSAAVTRQVADLGRCLVV